MGFKVINGKLQLIQDYKISNGNILKNNTSAYKKANNNLNKNIKFKDVLNNEVHKNLSNSNMFNISNHALTRLRDRNINFNEVDMKNINEAINKAYKKGSRDCLILYKRVALVTSIENRTVITAMDENESKDNVFTNIDSTIIL
ncbi:TIGR02530 family flagellar biosynthesis protein [Clostridium oceanicum]|uniref:TIGR02530 family flagellar biosynthesis protein n=1 Tax=Clostridium oceanicum TaxID=1543 RepID=A0ABP3V448_9CLOT